MPNWLTGMIAAVVSLLIGAALAQGDGAVVLEAPDRVAPAAMLEVRWRGPGAPGDFIALAKPEASAAVFLSYARTGAAVVRLKAPETLGHYELRYLAGGTLEILHRRTVLVAEEAARPALDAPTETQAGAVVEIGWAAEAAAEDFATIVPAGAAATAIGSYRRARDGFPLELEAPERAGSYEIRWVRARDLDVLAAAPLLVLPSAQDGAPPSPAEVPGPESTGGTQDGRSVQASEAELALRTLHAAAGIGSPGARGAAGVAEGQDDAAADVPERTVGGGASEERANVSEDRKKLEALTETGPLGAILSFATGDSQDLMGSVMGELQQEMAARQMAERYGDDPEIAVYAERMRWYDPAADETGALVLQPNMLAVLTHPNPEGGAIEVEVMNAATGAVLFSRRQEGPVLEYLDITRLGVRPADLSVRVSEAGQGGSATYTLAGPAE